MTRSLKRLGKKTVFDLGSGNQYQDSIAHHCWGMRRGEITLTILLYPDYSLYKFKFSGAQ